MPDPPVRTVYAVTGVTKDVCEDDFESGEVPRTEVCCLSNARFDIWAETLGDLIADINSSLALDVVPADCVAHDGELHWTRTETADGDVPSGREVAAWKAGTAVLYSARYVFGIEKRTVTHVPDEEFAALDIPVENT